MNTERPIDQDPKVGVIIDEILAMQNPEIPVWNYGELERVLREALEMDVPTINFTSIVCPNWGVDEEGKRTVLPMDDKLQRPTHFFGVDIRKLRELFDEHGIATNFLFVLSDIVEGTWTKVVGRLFEQNRRYIAGLVASNALTESKVPHRTMVTLQKSALGQLKGINHQALFSDFYMKVLSPSTQEGEAMFSFWRELDRFGAYPERRIDIKGLESIRNRTTFLSALYLADGAVMDSMVRTHLKNHNGGPVILVNAEMDLPFAKGLMNLWSIGMQTQESAQELAPIITPTRHGTDWRGELIT